MQRPKSVNAASLIVGSISVNLYEPRIVGSVGLLVVPLIPLALTILHPPLPYDSWSSAQWFTMGLCICFHQLLDEASLMS